MSVDVFGRQLGRTEGIRGPPGFGFKLTSNNQYDVENKRLCNVAESSEPKDAVNLELTKHLIQQELSGILAITAQQRKDLDDLHVKIQILNDQLNERLRKIEINIESTLELTIRNIKASSDAAWSIKD